MKTIIRYTKSQALLLPLFTLLFSLGFTSCAKMMDPDSEIVEYAENNPLSSAQDSLYSVLGIERQMQKIADRIVILGEVRADMVSPTNKADKDIKELANFSVGDNNAYNKASDYYNIINTCNYYLANVDTTAGKFGQKYFKNEYAVVKTFRAWTYLQLAKIYGQVPLVTKPITTAIISDKDFEEITGGKKYGIEDLCTYFIDDIKPYVDYYFPNYGEFSHELHSRKFFIPVRVLLGEMCLWTGRYQEAAEYLHYYITKNELPTGASSIYWANISGKQGEWYSIDSYSTSLNASNDEIISLIQMETTEFDGIKSNLENIFGSTETNNYYSQIVASDFAEKYFDSQAYVAVKSDGGVKRDTLYISGERRFSRGDLRLYASYGFNNVNRDSKSPYSPEVVTFKKLNSYFIPLYRLQYVYLMYAEALCRMGCPEAAFCVLKYGLRNELMKAENPMTNKHYVNQHEIDLAGELLQFADEVYKDANTKGIHSRGCGDVHCDKYVYVMPQPTHEMDYSDSVQVQIPQVEKLILQEMALETCFEGNRFYDLMRIAKRCGDNSVLALPIAYRDGSFNAGLYNLLMDEKNWYLPLLNK